MLPRYTGTRAPRSRLATPRSVHVVNTRPAKNGKDPGGHKRDPLIWDTQGGHYGHCHVPENTHWDPAYTAVEADYLLHATFDADGALTNRDDPKVAPLLARPAVPATQYPPQVIEDHADVGEDDA